MREYKSTTKNWFAYLSIRSHTDILKRGLAGEAYFVDEDTYAASVRGDLAGWALKSRSRFLDDRKG